MPYPRPDRSVERPSGPRSGRRDPEGLRCAESGGRIVHAQGTGTREPRFPIRGPKLGGASSARVLPSGRSRERLPNRVWFGLLDALGSRRPGPALRVMHVQSPPSSSFRLASHGASQGTGQWQSGRHSPRRISRPVRPPPGSRGGTILADSLRPSVRGMGGVLRSVRGVRDAPVCSRGSIPPARVCHGSGSSLRPIDRGSRHA